jgi:tetraacyldisaccharide 4'-kinase
MTEYLIKRQVRVSDGATADTATLSRGYGRRTTGFREAGPTESAATIGDEPLQLYRKFGHQVRVFVGERRADAIRTIQTNYPAIRQMLLDDAYQHRAVKPHLNVLLMDFNRPFYADYPFPAGRLRERRKGARRADVVVVTKCPASLDPSTKQQIRQTISRYTRPGILIFFAGLHYDRPVPFAGGTAVEPLDEVILLSGLANADPLEQYVQQTFTMKGQHRFADHWAYSRTDLDRICSALKPGVSVLTTEKDWVKLEPLMTPDERRTLPFYYLPVQLVFLDGEGQAFDQLVAEATLKFR